MTGSRGEITVLLMRWNRGDAEAFSQLMELVYADLCKVASGRISRHDGADPSLTTAELVHEAFFALKRQERTKWQNRAHFFAVAARLIWRVVAEQRRQSALQKHGGGTPNLSLEQWDIRVPNNDCRWVALDQALDRLAAIDQTAYRVVALRCVAGLSVEETAEILESSTATVGRRWRFARAWLRAQFERVELDQRPELAPDTPDF